MKKKLFFHIFHDFWPKLRFFLWKKNISAKNPNFSDFWNCMVPYLHEIASNDQIFFPRHSPTSKVDPQKILYPYEFHRWLHKFFCEKKRFSPSGGHVRKSSACRKSSKLFKSPFITEKISCAGILCDLTDLWAFCYWWKIYMKKKTFLRKSIKWQIKFFSLTLIFVKYA